MPRKHAQFSHRDKFSSYMDAALKLIPPATNSRGEALDIPAGAGFFGDALGEKGYRVTYADFNQDRPNFVFVDLNKKLPFEDERFDVVACLEGIEHVLDPFLLIGELARITKPGGQIVLSTPNIMNMYSRLCFFFTGTLYHHAPRNTVAVKQGERKDPGHISPVSYHQFRYLGQHHGFEIAGVSTDRLKKKILLPLWLLVYPIGRLWARRLIIAPKQQDNRDALRRSYSHTFSLSVLFGRTLILNMRKTASHAQVNPSRPAKRASAPHFISRRLSGQPIPLPRESR